MSKYNVEVNLVGSNGNAFAILGKVSAAMKKAGISKNEIEEYQLEAMKGDYDNLLRVTMATVKVS